MVLPASIAGHVHVSEREVAHTWPDGQQDDAHWEDCLWCSITEWLNDTYEDVPDTLAYAESLRAASGEPPTGGSTFLDVAKAFAKLKIDVAIQPLGFDDFWSALKPGTAGVANGSMGNFPSGNTLRRWDPGFAGGHSVYVARPDSRDQVWWCDPLAPNGAYQGQWVSKVMLQTFMSAGWTGVVRPLLPVTPAAPKPEDPMPNLKTYLPGYTTTIAGGVNVRPDATLTSKPFRMTAPGGEPWTIIGTVAGDKASIGAQSSTDWYVRFDGGHFEYATVLNSKAPKGPDTGATQADLDKARADGETAGKAAEQERLRTVLGL